MQVMQGRKVNNSSQFSNVLSTLPSDPAALTINAAM